MLFDVFEFQILFTKLLHCIAMKSQTEIFNNISSSSCLPAVRSLILKSAHEEFENGNTEAAISNQIQALCLGFRHKYLTDRNKVIQKKIKFTFHALHVMGKQGKCPLPEFFDNFKQRAFKNLRTKNVSDVIKYTDNADISENPSRNLNINSIETHHSGLGKLTETCKKFPKEWTVLHICKNYNAESSISLKSEEMNKGASIFISILKHPRNTEDSLPICIKINSRNIVNGDLFKIFSNLPNEFKEKFVTSSGPEHWKRVCSVNDSIKTAVENLKNMLGPWICLFAGEISEEFEYIEEEIFRKVNYFCQRKRLVGRQRCLLGILARQCHLLNSENINIASKTISNIKSVSSSISEFLQDLKSCYTIHPKYKPCILILDELVDFFFWEMLNPEQEICRISSLDIVNRLYEEYSSCIENGYVCLPMKKGNCVINPDKTLMKMETRMTNFFLQWLPHWKCTTGKPPSGDCISNLLSNDAYVYAGHGSGLQFVNGHKIAQVDSRAITFLFGCESVRLKSNGLNSELTGSHLYYHAALCPAVVGCLHIALDTQLNNLTSTLISNWIPSSEKKEPDVKLFDSKYKHEPEPRLSLNISKLRSNNTDHFFNRVVLIYRGLPILNFNKDVDAVRY